ncbi:hypothetical protein BDY19DRAFT_931436 [Irpex rosettiformis]|uniref:Uncharacterized protein n=1 Tax=Irpex rosettiformis TaxID=378272 RepID=A0ACB8UB47_9APHY|nr:hypothetical protein BDY19DRAFT_931436 [Irpex rosettiformis]
MRCDGQRPTCDQCMRSNILDCEYTDEGLTASQILEQNISALEARIRQLEGDPGSITLHDPHLQGSVSQTRGVSPEQSAANTARRNRLIMQAFINYAPNFGFFLHLPRFLEHLKASIPWTPQSPLPEALVYAVYLIGVLFATHDGASGSSDERLSRDLPQIFERAQQALSAQLDPSKVLYVLQAEVLLTAYLFHTNKCTACNYHAAAAMSIAVGCKLHKIRSAGWTGPGTSVVPEMQLLPPMDDVEEGERVRAFWTIFSLDRCLSAICHTPSLLSQQGTVATRVDTPWPLEMSEYEEHLLMPQGNTSARTVEDFLDGLTAESPNQSLLTLRAKAAVLFERSSRLAERWNPNDPSFQAQFVSLNTRIESLKAVLPALDGITAGWTRTQQLRELLVIYTLLYAAELQLHGHFEPSWDVDRSKALNAAISAAQLLRTINVCHLKYVDPLMGMLWGLIGRSLANALVKLKQNIRFTMSPSVAVSPQEIMVTTSLTRILDAMDTLRENSPLIAEEADKLQALVAQNQEGTGSA